MTIGGRINNKVSSCSLNIKCYIPLKWSVQYMPFIDNSRTCKITVYLVYGYLHTLIIYMHRE